MTDPTEWGAEPVESPESWGAVPVQEPEQQRIPQAFIDRMRSGFEMQNAAKQTTGATFEQRFNEVYGDPFDAAAKRTREAVRPSGGRQEGIVTGIITHPWVIPAGLLDVLLVKPIIAHHELSGEAQRGELDYGDPETYGKAAEAAALGMLRATRFSRVTAEGVQRIGSLPTAEDFRAGATVLQRPPESIKTAALKIGDDVYTGINHAVAMDDAQKKLGLPWNEFRELLNKSEDGFLTSEGRFVGRSEAERIASGQGQISDEGARRLASRRKEYGESDFSSQLVAEDLQLKNTEQNLRDLWDERGVHPAEAVHDAQSDAFLRQELTRPNPDPHDRSGIVPVQGSPMPEGTPRTELAKTGEPHIDQVLDSAVTNRNIDNPVIVDAYDVPYGAGGSEPLEDPQVFIDRRFPRSMTIDGVTFDPADPFTVHENIEQHVMEILTKGGMDDATAYKVAHHEWAEKAEGAWYRAHGIDQAKAEEAYRPFLDRIEHEKPVNPPPNLYEKPYPHQDVRSAEAGPVEKPTAAEIERAKEIVAQEMAKPDMQPISLGAAARTPAVTGKMAGVSFEVTQAQYEQLLAARKAGAGRAEIQRMVDQFRGVGEVEPGATASSAALRAGSLRDRIVDAFEGAGGKFGTKPAALADIRRILSDVPRQELDAELRRMNTDESARAQLYQNDNRAILTQADKDAALYIGNDPRHLLWMSDRPPRSLGAAATGMPSLDEQPPPRAGSLAARARESLDKLFGLGRNIQFLLDPMATGSNRAMVVAKDAVNAVRRIDWEWMRLDQEIMRRFKPEQQERMWNAGDEESVALQLGEDRTHQGWATLEPDERQFVEYVDGLGQQAWLHAVDAGLVEGEGLPAYMPRMLLNVAAAEGKSPRALNELGRNVFTRTAQMLRREYMMAEETEEAMRAKFGDEAGIARNIRALPLAIAKMEKAAAWRTMINNIEDIGKATGEDTVAHGFQPDKGWFTIEGHPAFRKWKPDLEQGPDGTWSARRDENGNVIFKPEQLWISPEFKGPLRAILDEPADKFKIVPGAPSLYSALMTLKGKAMTTILNSPLIHNEVVWGKVMEAAGGREWLGFGLYFRGNRIVNNPGRAGELIERGLNPIGPRGSFQDITAMLEQPNLRAGRSWTSQLLSAIPDLFDPAAGDAVRRAIDKAGDFWHNTLLWDRVRDVQFGLADHLSDKLVNQGVNRVAADRIAAHFSNIIVGSLPKESMSAGAQATANIFLFSRSFTLGNLSTFKQAFTGLPKPIKAQLQRDFGLVEGPEGMPMLDPAAEAAFKSAKGMARRKAIATIAASAALYYIGNALFENGFNIAMRDSSLEEEMNGYARRYHDAMKAVGQDPWELRHLLGRLSPTYDNEPQKSDRVHIGYDQDGTAIYGRLPFGKFGEEMVGYPTMPLEMLKRKLSPPAATAWELFDNDKGFGRKIYDDTNGTALNDVHTAIAVAKHIVMRELPEGQISAAADLLRGEGDATVNKLRVFGPMAGFTASLGAPGGMQKGEQLAAKQSFDTRFNLAWPDIKKQIKNGDIAAASQAMMDLGVPMRMQRGLMRAALMPGNISGKALQDLFQYGRPEQIERFLNAR